MSDATYYKATMRKRVDRVRIALLSGHCEVTQTHRNGSDEIVGKIELDDIGAVRDLQYLLECVVREFSGG
jgi:hypothetical protein